MLSACGTTLIEPAPKQMVSARFATQAPQAGNTIDFNWWAQLNDAQLNELLQLARQNSPDLRSAAASVMQARAVADQDRADQFPSLTGSAARTASREDGSPRRKVGTAALDASWEIDLFGRARETARASRLSARAEEVAYAGSYVSLSAEVADGYVQYRACKQVEAVYREALRSQQGTVKATGDLVTTGLAGSGDGALASANAATAAISLQSGKASCRVLAQGLAVIVGVSQSQIDEILSRGSAIPRAKAFRAATVPAEALRQRPDVIEAELNFASALADMGAARADLFPSLGLDGSVTLTNPSSWSFGPALSLPILDGGARKAGLKTANASAILAGETYRKTVLSAVAEIEGAMTELGAARANGASARSAVAGYKSHFAVIDESWRAGFETLITREEARRSLQTAQITEIQQREEETRQWIALFKAMGGGWTTEARQ
ncbi:efflux transporter outer membrane subunit [Paracoccus aestuariivivens]|nr:efflux transporter outer membrane subunit [Paracoccus aestuariivivens]